MLLKDRLDAVWNDHKIGSPCHVNIWSETPSGYLKYAEYCLFYKHGKLLGPRKGKVRKGYSFLSKYFIN